MKKAFESPEIEVNAFQAEDILTTSSTGCGATGNLSEESGAGDGLC